MKNALAVATLIIAIYVLTPAAAAGQQVEDNDVVKITTKLVQVDVVVTDKDGDQVPDLSADEFEILQDGKPQKITGITYVGSPKPAAEQNPKNKDKNAAPPPPVRVRPSGAGRVITFVVDDGNCQASQSGMIAAREGLQKFIREQMLTGDLVAIYRTRAGSSMLQQYTSDKAQLLKAASKVRWLPAYGSCGTDGSYYEAARINTIDLPGKAITVESDRERLGREHAEDYDRNNQTVGSIGVLRYVVRGLAGVAGRKLLFFISDGLPNRARSGERLTAADVLRDVTDLANRSSVVVNTIDNRGVYDPSIIEAKDEVSVLNAPNATGDLTATRDRDSFNAQDGLAFLARETGGMFEQGQNYLDVPIRRTLSRQTGYYLLAYEPSEDSFKGKKFNKIDVKVSRPDLKVAFRAGFLPVAEVTTKPKKRSESSDLYEAIMAPIPKPGLNVRLSALFVNSAPGTNLVRAMLHLEGDQIEFVDGPGDMKKAVLDVVAVTLNEKNDVIDEFTRSHEFKVPANAIPYILKNGLVYAADVPVKKAGTYNFRVAVRDGTSKKLGSAIEVVQIPDLKKNELTLGALSMSGVDGNGGFTVPGPADLDKAISVPVSMDIPAVRRFRRGSVVTFTYTLYNVRLNPVGKPDLTIQMNLWYDGKLVLDGKPAVTQIDKQDDWKRIQDYARFKLGTQMAPGDYVLQLIVTDKLAQGKGASTRESIDFEVVE